MSCLVPGFVFLLYILRTKHTSGGHTAGGEQQSGKLQGIHDLFLIPDRWDALKRCGGVPSFRAGMGVAGSQPVALRSNGQSTLEGAMWEY